MRKTRFPVLLAMAIVLPILVLLLTHFAVTALAVPWEQPPDVPKVLVHSDTALHLTETQTRTVYLPLVTGDAHGCVTWEFRGVSMDGYWHTAFASPMAYDYVDYFDAIGVNYVALIVNWYQPTITSTGPITATQRTVSDKDLVRIIDYIHSKDMGVMLKPHVDPEYPEAGWRGTFTPTTQCDPEIWYEAWFSNFEDFIVHYADLAEQNGVEIFCIGTEYVSLTNPATGNTPRWLDVIDTVRGRYHGKLTYAAHMGPEYRLIPKEVWQRLDYAGVNLYYTLSIEATPQVDDLCVKLEGVAFWSTI